MRKILAIDPGTIKSAYCIASEDYTFGPAGKVENETVLRLVKECEYDEVAIECMESRFLGGEHTAGQRIGSETYDTCIWIGRYMEAAATRGKQIARVYRSEERSRIIPSKRNRLPPLPEPAPRGTDAQIRAALIRRFARHDMKNGKGTAGNKDVFYGFRADMWSAAAVAVVYLDRKREADKGGEA